MCLIRWIIGKLLFLDRDVISIKFLTFKCKFWLEHIYNLFVTRVKHFVSLFTAHVHKVVELLVIALWSLCWQFWWPLGIDLGHIMLLVFPLEKFDILQELFSMYLLSV